MSEPRTGAFKIVSLIEDGPTTGVAPFKPPFQTVYLNEPVQIWRLTQYWASPETFLLALDAYPYTGVLEAKVVGTVFAEQDLKWHITYRDIHDAYTIELENNRGMGWTVSSGHPDRAVEIAPIASTKSIPPQFSPSQLFRFIKVDK